MDNVHGVELDNNTKDLEQRRFKVKGILYS